ncbi:MAG: DUF4998 domain-containing protein [Flavobacteriaceae bacterium]|nr:DUF4998 domain-containing protein [Flavobacteriaceae bacterium]
MEKYKIKIYSFLFYSLSLLMISCETTVETFEKFTREGEKILLGKPLSVTVNPGNQRAEFVVEINSDPKINAINISWTEPDGTLRSHDIDYTRTKDGNETLIFELDDISEGTRSFVFTSLSDSGLKSLKLEVNEAIYGPIYQSGLLPRQVVSTMWSSSHVTFSLSNSFPNTVTSTELIYEDASGSTQKITIDNSTESVNIESYNRDKKVLVKSLHRPSPNAIDTFLTNISQEVSYPDTFTLDRTLWQLVSLNNDIPSSLSVWGPINELSYCWDGDPTTWGAYIGETKPVHFTIDLGLDKPLQLKRFYWPGFPVNRNEEIKDYQIWGISDITDADTTVDAGTDLVGWETEMESKGWVKLLEGTRPQADDTYSAEITNKTKVKYIRVVPLNNQASGNMLWGDLSFDAYF